LKVNFEFTILFRTLSKCLNCEFISSCETTMKKHVRDAHDAKEARHKQMPLPVPLLYYRFTVNE